MSLANCSVSTCRRRRPASPAFAPLYRCRYRSLLVVQRLLGRLQSRLGNVVGASVVAVVAVLLRDWLEPAVVVSGDCLA